jgi:hypothetical protein
MIALLALTALAAASVAPVANVYAEGEEYPIVTPEPTPQPPRTPIMALTAPMYVRKVEQGYRTYVEVEFTNVGNWRAEDVTIIPEPNSNLSLSFDKGANKAGTVQPGRSVTFNLYITADKGVKAGTYPVGLECNFFDAETLLKTVKGTFHVTVTSPDEDDGKPATPPGAYIGNIKGDGAKYGRTFTLTAAITAADADAKAVSVGIGGLSSEGISLPGGAGSVYFDTIARGTPQPISFTLMAADKIESGSYPVTLKLAYHDADGKEFTAEYTYYVYAEGRPDDDAAEGANLTASVASPTGTFDTAQRFTATVTVRNEGDKTARFVTVAVECPEGIVPNSSSKVSIASLAPGESRSVSFTASATAASATQSYTIGFPVEYETGSEKDGATQKRTFTQYAPVSVVNSKADAKAAEEEDKKDEDKNKSVPKIIVSKYSADPMIVQAGQEFDLNLTFQNTHRVRSVENIKANLTVPVNSDGNKSANVFSPVNASNTFFVDSIPPKGESEQRIRMFTIPDAQAKNYVLVLEFEYEDTDGNQIKSTSEIGVNVKQTAKLELGDYVVTPSATVGDQLFLEFSVQNTGKVNLNNLKIKLTGEGFDTSSAEVIYGNFTSGSHDYYSAQFAPTAPGTNTLKLIVSYDEDTGEHVETVTEHQVEVMDFSGGDVGDGGFDPGMDGPIGGDVVPPPEEGNWLVTAGIIAGAVVLLGAAAAVIIVVVRRKRRQREFDIDA